MQRTISTLIAAVLFIPTTSADVLYEFDLDTRYSGAFYDIRTEIHPEYRGYRTIPIPSFHAFVVPEKSHGTFLITSDAKVGTKDLYLAIPAATGDLTRNHPVPGTFTNVDIDYHVEMDPFVLEVPGEHYRQLYQQNNPDRYMAKTGILPKFVRAPSTLTGHYRITGPTEESSGTITIPITPINTQDWEGPLSDGNQNAAAQTFYNSPDNWWLGQRAVGSGVGGGINLYHDENDWILPCDLVVGTVDGVAVSLSYAGNRVEPRAMPTPIPEPSTYIMACILLGATLTTRQVSRLT